jgi:hypothetical protein
VKGLQPPRIVPFQATRKATWSADRRTAISHPFVERHSRYVLLVKVANKDIQNVITALIKSA